VRWLEVTLVVEREQADDVAAALMPYSDGGIALSSSQIEDTPGQGIPAGPMIVHAYLSADDELHARRERIEHALHYLGRIRALPEPTYRWIEEEDWQHKWKQRYHPITIGERLIIVPAWDSSPDPARIPIFINPGMAFGTGAHPTTRLCLLALETILTGEERIADLGSGSGILSIAARKLGAAQVHGWDVDKQTVSIARENASKNGVDNVRFDAGSLGDLLQSPHAPFDVVIANIFAHVLTTMLDQEGLSQSCRPGGYLILSGILEEQLPPILTLAESRGCTIVEVLTDSDWTAVILQKEEGTASR